MSVGEFYTLVTEGENTLFETPGISVGAATQISWEFEFGKARFDIACFQWWENVVSTTEPSGLWNKLEIETALKGLRAFMTEQKISFNKDWARLIINDFRGE